jgi:hypothetical protein
MAKDRDHRYNSTSDLLQDLEALAKGDPPLQARRKFDLASLASLEDAKVDEHGTAIINTVELDEDAPPMTQQPMFWAMVGGWAVSVVLLILLILLKGG